MNNISTPVSFDRAAFRQVMGCFATGVAVVTAANDTLGAFGVTVNSLTSVSLDPPLLLFCLDKGAGLHQAFVEAERFAINFLAQGQEDVSRFFASRHQPQPENLWDASQQNCPIVGDGLGWVLCRPYARHAGGDHTIFVGEVVDFHKRETTLPPLLYFQGRYRELAALGNDTSGARK